MLVAVLGNDIGVGVVGGSGVVGVVGGSGVVGGGVVRQQRYSTESWRHCPH